MKAFKRSVIAAFLVLSGACATVPADSFPDPGHVLVTVTDQNNAAVSGATIQLIISPSGLVWRSAVTDGSGKAGPGETDGGVLPGDYNANILPPTGYAIASAQTNPLAITVQSNKTINLSYKLTKGP